MRKAKSKQENLFALADKFLDDNAITFAHEQDRVAGTIVMQNFAESVLRDAAEWLNTIKIDCGDHYVQYDGDALLSWAGIERKGKG